MDYSLLLAIIKDKNSCNKFEFNDKDNRDKKYAIGIIDYT
jgi:hypothetical protein